MTRAGNSRGWQWSTVTVPAVLKRDGHRCVMCGQPCPHPKHHHVDHIRPHVAGGSDTDMRNLRTVCASFNQGKGCK